MSSSRVNRNRVELLAEEFVTHKRCGGASL
jgi:hypothetical protein